MLADVETAQPQSGLAQRVATRIIFFIAGLGMAAWAPLVPFAKARVGIDDGVLGLLLLCLGGGSMVTMPLAGAFAARFGCRAVFTGSTLMLAAALPLLASVTSLPLLVAALLVFGAGVGAMDVSMNIQAIIVERHSGRSIMSGFHGLFSLGGITGAAGVTALFAFGAGPLGAALVVAAIVVACLVVAFPYLLTYGSRSDGPAFAIPHGVVLFIGILCFITFLTEGAMLDWSAVFLTSVRDVTPDWAGLGYAAFAVTMTIGRLSGDRIVSRFGPRRVIVFGGICAGCGLLLATFVPVPAAALAGFALVGVGCSNIVPVLFSSVGRQKVMPEAVAVPAITTLGYAGILVGPAAIGFIAHAASLPVAFAIVALLLFGVAVSAKRLDV